ncbi:UrcA family protein [Allosphingosinicella deserti]
MATFACATLIGQAEAGAPAQQLRIDVSDLDLRSGKGKVTRDYRVGASAAAACDIGESQRSSDFQSCIDLAVQGARRTCRGEERPCLVPIDPRARAIPLRLNLGPRSTN